MSLFSIQAHLIINKWNAAGRRKAALARKQKRIRFLKEGAVLGDRYAIKEMFGYDPGTSTGKTKGKAKRAGGKR